MRLTIATLLATLSLAGQSDAPNGAHALAASSVAQPPADNAAVANVTMRAHADPVADYTLKATLDATKHTIHGEGTIRWRNTSNVAVHDLWLHLYLNAFKNERSVFLREPVGSFRGSRVSGAWGAIDVRSFAIKNADGSESDLWPSAETHRAEDEDETDVRVPLPHEVASNEAIEIHVTWDDTLPAIVERTGYDGTFHFAGQWFPKLARLEHDGRWAHFPFHRLSEFYADFGTYDVTLDVPSDFRIGATGRVVSEQIANGRRVERHVQSDVHDFAWTAWDRFQIESEEIDGVTVKVLYPPGYEAVAHRELATIRFALPHFGARYGRYPYDVLTLVHPPASASEAGGMEYPTLITTGGPWWEPSFVGEIELVTIHEFGHQYFYGLVASDESSWPFLDEGINSFAEAESLNAWRGAGSAGGLAGLTVSDTSIHAVFGNRAAKNEPIAQSAAAFATGTDYARLVYSRTATILETYKRVYGEEKFNRALGEYAREFRFLHPVPEDLFTRFGNVLGPGAARTMRTAFFDKGWVDYAIAGIHTRRTSAAAGLFDRNGTRETVHEGTDASGAAYEGWILVQRRGTLAFPVTIELTLDDGSTKRIAWDGVSEMERLPYEGPVGIRSATIDPDHAVLLDDNLTNNFASQWESTNASRTLERVTYWAELIAQVVSP